MSRSSSPHSLNALIAIARARCSARAPRSTFSRAGAIDVKLGCDQRRGGDGKLIQRGGHEPQPAQRTDRRGDREAAMHAAMCRDRLELVVGKAKERRQRALIDLLREALPFCALSRREDLDRHQNSISRSATAF
jgi:hypothetical protein